MITEYPLPLLCCSAGPIDITVGPDGALWFTNLDSYWIGRITTQGELTTYATPLHFANYGITRGSDGAFWFTSGTSAGAAIWRITTEGVFSSFDLPTKDANLSYITSGPDKALWFTEGLVGQIGRITTGGVFAEYYVGGGYVDGPVAIVTGSDGNVWFGKQGSLNKIVLADTTPPVVTLSVTPSLIWPPNDRMVPITVRGKITDAASGVLASTVEYTVKDEYGLVQPNGHITLDGAGNYSFTLLLRASRDGKDSDGRTYHIQVSAYDNAGNRGVKWSNVIVPHDQH